MLLAPSAAHAALVPLLTSGAPAIAPNNFTPVTPRSHMGGVFKLDAGAGTSNIPIGGGKLYLFVVDDATYQNVQVNVTFWGTAGDGAGGTPVFSNSLGTYSRTYENISLESHIIYPVRFNLPSPIVVPTDTVGVTINWKTDTGNGLADDDNLTSVIRTNDPLPVGSLSLGVAPTYGFYQNVSGETDDNFLGGSLRTLSGGQTDQAVAIDLAASIPGAPTLTDVGVYEIMANSVVFHATVNHNGAPCTTHIYFGTTTAYGRDIVSDYYSGDFEWENQTGETRTYPLPDFKPGTTYHYRYVISNAYGTVDSGDKTFTTLDNAPTGITLSNNTINESAGSNAVVGLLTGTDPDALDSLTYSLPAGLGDNRFFNINAGQLRANGTFNKATKASYLVTVRVTDLGGLTFDQQFTIAITENAKPTVAIVTPAMNQKLYIQNFLRSAIKGTARDDVAVTGVKVRLSRKRGTTNYFWNGTDFLTAQTTLSANVTGTTGATWDYSNRMPLASKLDAGLYQIQVSASDAAGKQSNYADCTFTLKSDDLPPTIGLAAPTANQKMLVSEFLAGGVKGTAADAEGVVSVKVRLQRKSGTATVYWNGSEFTPTPALVNADLSGTTNASWKLQSQTPPASQLTAGAYSVAVYATDAAGNKSETLSVSFSLNTDYLAPSVSIGTPANNASVNINALGAGAITGSADDNLGVVAVKLKLQRKRGTETVYWNGSDFTPTVAQVDATLTPGAGTVVTWQLSQPIPASKLDKGSYTLYASASDAAGNATTSASRVFTVTGTVVSAVTSSAAGS